MVLFNRVVVILLLVVAMLVVTLLSLSPMAVIRELGQGLLALTYALQRIDQWLRLLLGMIVALVFDLLCILAIFFELRRPRQKAIRIQRISGGEARLGIDTIARRVEYHVDRLADVVNVRPKISARRGGVMIELDVETAAEVDVPAKAEEIIETTCRVVEDKMGLKLADEPRVRLHASVFPPPSLPEEARHLPPSLLEAKEQEQPVA